MPEVKAQMRRWLLPLVAVAVVMLALAVAALVAGDILSRPAAHAVGAPPAGFAAQTVRLSVGSGEYVVGWLKIGRPAAGAVLLVHGLRGNRTQMLGRARFLADAGYTTLLLDLPAHGESSGTRITFGAREAEGVAAAARFLRQELPGERLGLVGVSLGAAAAVLADIKPPLQAVVLESIYATIEEAVTNRLRLRWGALGAPLAPMLLWQLPSRTGVKADELRPIEHIAALGAPLLLASGAEDRHTPWAETLRLYQAAAHPKELWRVEGAAHVDLHAHAPHAYQQRILRFLARHLRDES